MKVGAVLSQRPDFGGGYTFEMELLGALRELIDESGHSFSILSPRERLNEIQTMLQGTGMNVIPYRRFDTRVVIEECFSSVSWALGLLYHKFFRRGGLEYAARRRGMEVLWFLNASVIPVDIPYIATVWDLQHRTLPWFPEISAEGKWDSREQRYSRFLRRATAVITGTEVGRSEVETFYQIPRDRITVLPHPTPIFSLASPESDEADTDKVMRKYGIQGDYLFYPAQFWPHKNHENLLLAVRKLVDDHGLNYSVVFAGSDKGNESYLRKRVGELGLLDRVLFLGFIPRTDLIALYRRAFALLYVSFGGPENLPPLEAFALGCPVIASRVPGAVEQLGNAALLVDPKNPEDIAQAVAGLHQDPSKRSFLIGLGYRRAESWKSTDFVRGVFAVLDELSGIRRCWSV